MTLMKSLFIVLLLTATATVYAQQPEKAKLPALAGNEIMVGGGFMIDNYKLYVHDGIHPANYTANNVNLQQPALTLQYNLMMAAGAQAGIFAEYAAKTGFVHITGGVKANKIIRAGKYSYIYPGASILVNRVTFVGSSYTGVGFGFQFGLCLGVSKHIAFSIEPAYRILIGSVKGSSAPMIAGFRYRF